MHVYKTIYIKNSVFSKNNRNLRDAKKAPLITSEFTELGMSSSLLLVKLRTDVCLPMAESGKPWQIKLTFFFFSYELDKI